jgi:hypothetical protein
MFVLRLVLFLLLVLACLPRTAHAQTPADSGYQYIPFPTDSAEWKVYYEWFSPFWTPEERLERLHTFTYTMRGDTTFANGIRATKVYLQVTKAVNDSAVLTNHPNPFLFLRNEGKKVLKCRESTNSETQEKEYSEEILYDFGLLPGERFSPATFWAGSLRLVDTTYETVAGLKRRKLIFSSPLFSRIEVWYEGIGSLNGLFETAFSELDVVDTLYLACFSHRDDLQYLSPVLNYCTDSAYYRKSTSLTRSLIGQPRVYPSPTSSRLTVEWPTVAGSGTTLMVSGMDGRPVYPVTPIHPQASKTEVPVSGLSPGSYMIRVLRYGQPVHQQLFTITN